METITLERIHKDIIELKSEVNEIRNLMSEDFELADDVSEEIKESRKRHKKELIAHEAMRQEFG